MKTASLVIALLLVVTSSSAQQQSIESTTETIQATQSTDQTPFNYSTSQPDIINFTEPTTSTVNNFWTQLQTTMEPTTTTTQPPWTPETIHPDQYEIDSYMHCSCDLLVDRCDVNCCCDIDCSMDERQLFSDCWTPPQLHFKRKYHCSSLINNYLAWNSTAYEHNGNGLFCIVKDNTPKRRMYEEMSSTRKEELIRQVLPKIAHRWEDHAQVSQMEPWIYEPFYKKGSPLFTLNQNGTFSIFSKSIYNLDKMSEELNFFFV